MKQEINKGRRQELKMLKYISRIKRFVANGGYFYTKDMIRVESPTVQDVINDNGNFGKYKTTSCPCNCYMCTYLKYNRCEQKVVDNKIIKGGLEDFYNGE